jgi:hypothetical protein
MGDWSDSREIRNRLIDAEGRSLDDVEEGAGAPCRVGTTSTQGAYPTTSLAFYYMTITAVTGSEVEGATATFTAGTDHFFACNIGSAIPPIGTELVCTFVDYRWTFRYG